MEFNDSTIKEIRRKLESVTQRESFQVDQFHPDDIAITIECDAYIDKYGDVQPEILDATAIGEDQREVNIYKQLNEKV